MVIFLKLRLNFSSFGVGLGWVLGGFWERLEQVWAGFVKVLGGLEGSWEEFGEVLEGFSTMCAPLPPREVLGPEITTANDGNRSWDEFVGLLEHISKFILKKK